MTHEQSKIIPINRSLVRALDELLKVLVNQPWNGPKKFNAVYIDRKGFMKMDEVPNPPPPVTYFAILPIFSTHIEAGPRNSVECHRIAFHFYRRIGDTIEYREEGF